MAHDRISGKQAVQFRWALRLGLGERLIGEAPGVSKTWGAHVGGQMKEMSPEDVRIIHEKI